MSVHAGILKLPDNQRVLFDCCEFRRVIANTIAGSAFGGDLISTYPTVRAEIGWQPSLRLCHALRFVSDTTDSSAHRGRLHCAVVMHCVGFATGTVVQRDC